jgi:hypothetical protein
MDFQLTKEEIRITKFGGFYVPIHPRLFDPNLRFDPELGSKTFREIPSSWHDELRVYLDGLNKEDENLEFFRREFLKKRKPKVIEEYGEQRLDTIPSWSDRVHTDERGFATSLMINRNGGGSLYYTSGDRCCEKGVTLAGEDNIFFNLSASKIEQLVHERHGEFGEIRVYAQHNIDYYPGALFLRNWALAYVNAAMASI